MTPVQTRLTVVAVAIAAAVAGFLVGGRHDTGQAALRTPISGAPLIALKLVDPAGNPATLADWKHEVLVVNFWATWCAPCREEMPEFSRVSESFASKGVQFVGIGVDTPQNVQRFAQETPVAYPLLIGAGDALQAASAVGNDLMALPFTAVLDRSRQVVQTKLGKMDRRELEDAIEHALDAGASASR